ncbi:MAG TPA: winged helix-turn-helix domain-containing protein [Terriglobales bacterium]|nr:winged helix-turn-helix domain-containing protein [Terriglobales bacterium]
MPDQSQVPASIRFGPYEIAVLSGELRKHGIRLKLSGQAMQVLLLLAEEPGRVVSREELQRRLWPGTTYGDFDHGLNAAVNRLREVLGDSANTPKYIETVPRRGYRFIAQTEVAANDHDPKPESANGNGTLVESSAKPRKGWSPWLISGAALIVLAAVVLPGISLQPGIPIVGTVAQITHEDLAPHGVVTDGERIYFAREQTGFHLALAQVAAVGGDISAITQYADAYPVAISKDGSQLLASMDWSGRIKEQGELTVLPLPAGSPHRLGIMSHAAAWTPDGQSIVFARDSGIYIAHSDGSDIRKLGAVQGEVHSLKLSPDGQRIRFTQSDAAEIASSIWEARIDGSGMHPLFRGWHNPPSECCGDWTPDGRYFVFQSRDSAGRNIWAVADRPRLFQKQTPVRLTMGPLEWLGAVPSKDGHKLFAVGAQYRGELVRYDATAEQYVPYLSGMSATDLDFSRDGKWVTYVTIPNGVLRRSHVDGSERLELTNRSGRATLPRWSPDGKWIAFDWQSAGKPWSLRLISSDGGTPRELFHENLNQVDPTWSNDGNFIAFGRVDMGVASDDLAIFVLNLKTGTARLVPGSKGWFSPRWSPDGRYIAAIKGDYSKLGLFDVKNQSWSDWVETSVNYPTWSNDSRSVYFDNVFASPPFFAQAQLGSSQLKSLYELGEIRRLWGTWGAWSGIAPDASGLFVRDVSPQQIYAIDVDWP